MSSYWTARPACHTNVSNSLTSRRSASTANTVLGCREKADVFRANGFEIITGDDGAALLTAVPFSRNTTFGAADVLELVSLLNDGDAAPLPMSRSASDSAADTIIRPSKCACYLR